MNNSKLKNSNDISNLNDLLNSYIAKKEILEKDIYIILDTINAKKLKLEKTKGNITKNKLEQELNNLNNKLIKLNDNIININNNIESTQLKINNIHKNTYNIIEFIKPFTKPTTYNPIFKILNSSGSHINKIIHIADIHIKFDSQHEDYNNVFNTFYQELIEIKKTNQLTIICICGDILDTKYTYNTNVLLLARNFLKNLSNIFPVFIIAGNHDIIENNNSIKCSISAILDLELTSNIYYLQNSGVYIYNNIIFSVSSLIDHYILSKTETDNILLENNYICDEYSRNICLYHGYFTGVKLNDNNIQLKNRNINLSDLGNYDYIMLGDIHKFQYLNDKKTIAYPSSLISHNFSETDIYHGYIEWDILNYTSNYHILKNDFAYHKIKINLLLNNNILDNQLIIKHLDHIKSGYLRIEFPHDTTLIYNHVIEEINKIYPKFIITYNVYDQIDKIDQNNIDQNNIDQIDQNNIDIINDNNENNLFNFTLEEDLIEYIKLNYKDVKNDDIKEIIRYLTDTTIFKDDKKEEIYNDYVNSDWKIQWLSFNYMYGYGPYNIIDFTKFPNRDIIGIFGENTYGKSSLIDIIIYMLYSICPSTKKLPIDIINMNAASANGEMIIESENKLYLIKRQCYRIDENTIYNLKRIKHHLFLYELSETENVSEKKYELYGKMFKKTDITNIERRKTNDILKKIVGSYNYFVTTSVLFQGIDLSFKSKNQIDKKKYLCEILKINNLTQNENYIICQYKNIEKQISQYLQQLYSLLDINNTNKKKQIYDYNIKNNVTTAIKESEEHIQKNNILINDYEKKIKILTNNIPLYFKEPDVDIKNNDQYNIILKKLSINEKQKEKIENIINAENIKINNISIPINNINTNDDSEKKNIEETIEKINVLNTKRQKCNLNKVLYNIDEIDSLVKKYETQLNTTKETIEILEINIINSKNIINNLKLINKSEEIIENNTINKNLKLETQKNILFDINNLEQKKNYIKIPNNINKKNIINELKTLNEFFNDINTVNLLNSKDSIINNYTLYINSNTDLIYSKLNELKDNSTNLNQKINEIIIILDIVLKKNIDEKNKNYKEYNNINTFLEEYEEKKKKEIEYQLIINNIEQINFIENNINTKKEEYSKIIMENTIEYINLENEINIKNNNLEIINDLNNQLNNNNIKKQEIINNINLLEENYILNKENNIILNNINKIDDEISILYKYLYNNNLYKILEQEKIITQTKDNIIKYQNQLNDIKNDINNINNNINEYNNLTKIKNENNNIKKIITEVEKEILKIQNDINILNKNNENYITNINILNNKLNKILEIEILFEQNNKELSLFKMLKDICSNDGLQLYILKKHINKISSKINNILEPFINKKINIVIDKTTIITQIISDNNIIQKISGMESLMLDIAFKIIISKLSIIPKSNILFIDESLSVFDKNKMENIDDFFSFLNLHFKNIFLITHMQQIKNNIDHYIDIVKCNNYSLIFNGIKNIKNNEAIVKYLNNISNNLNNDIEINNNIITDDDI